MMDDHRIIRELIVELRHARGQIGHQKWRIDKLEREADEDYAQLVDLAGRVPRREWKEHKAKFMARPEPDTADHIDDQVLIGALGGPE